MATTTEILLNSPALHSLKRDQLVKLCKIHSIKANGKNVELIERLKEYAHGLPVHALADPEDDAMEGVEELPGSMPGSDPEDITTTIAVNHDIDNDNVRMDCDGGEYDMQDLVLTSRFAIPRPSEQWEIVMEDIEEADEVPMGTASSKDSLRTVSNGEFGTHSSKTTMSSSIKALATSLGIKRVTSKSSHQSQTQDIDADQDTNPKMHSFSPGKLFGSTKARDSLAAHATPYSEIPPSDSLPDTDIFKFSTPDASILGLDDETTADDDGDGNADLNSLPRPTLRMGGGVKSTIRLVSQPGAPRGTDNFAYMSPPRLPVVKTDFDLTVGTPGTMRSYNVWPASPRTAGERLYPMLPVEDLNPSTEDGQEEDDEEEMPGGLGMPTATPGKTPAKSNFFSATSATKATNTPGPVDEPDMFSPSKPKAVTSGSGAAATPRAPIPRSTPFLFGSPLPRREPGSAIKSIERTKPDDATVGVSNAAFDGVAKSVLEEMHRRVAEANAQKAQDGDTVKSRPLPTPPIFGGLTFAAPPATAGTGVAQDRFMKAHQAEFEKMDSIVNHYAARRPNKRKSDALGHGRPSIGQKRRSSAAGARVISAGSRKRMAVPGGFGGEEDDEDGEEDVRDQEDEEDAGARRSSKRMRITQGWDVHRGQRVSLAPPLPPAEEEKKLKERDAVKRDLDAAKARRRSSRGRPSMGAPPAKGKASRFGFLTSAKSLVRNVWNMGGNSKAKPTAGPSSIPVPKASQAPAPPASSITEKKGEKSKADAAPKQPPSSAGNTRKASGPQPRVSSMTSTSSKLLKPSGSATDAKASGTITSTKSTSSRSRSPIPPFTVPSGPAKSTAPAVSRPSSIVDTARSRASNASTSTGTTASRQTGRTSTVSSMGTRTSITSNSSAAVSSVGTRRSLVSPSNTASSSSRNDRSLSDVKEQPTLRKRTSSLLAPTASSLAKTNATVKPSLSGRTSGLPSVAETQPKSKRASVTQASSRASIMSANSPPSARPTRIFSQPLTNFFSPASSPSGPGAHHSSLAAAATSIMHNAKPTEVDAVGSSPSKIPRPAVLPPKPKQLIARKPRISRSRVIAKLGAQRAVAAQGEPSLSPGTRTRSSFGAAAARRSLGGVKSGGGRASAGADVVRAAAKKRARQSEYMRRKSRATGENDGPEDDD